MSVATTPAEPAPDAPVPAMPVPATPVSVPSMPAAPGLAALMPAMLVPATPVLAAPLAVALTSPRAGSAVAVSPVPSASPVAPPRGRPGARHGGGAASAAEARLIR